MRSSRTLSGLGDDGTHDVVIRNLKIALLLTLVLTVGILIYETFTTYTGAFPGPTGAGLHDAP